MQINFIEAKNILPIEQFSAGDLSNVVVLAGPNGVGKTRLIQGLLQAFQSGSVYPNMRLGIEATTKAEIGDWGKYTLDTSVQDDVSRLILTLQKNQRRRTWRRSMSRKLWALVISLSIAHILQILLLPP